MRYPTNNDDMIDTRDVIAALDELNDLAESDALDDEETELRIELQSFADELESYADDYEHGATCIRDRYFVTYAQELADAVGAVADANWPNSHIDWTAAAEELQSDYSSVEFATETYWVR
jgi:antirestriction protein